MIKLGLSSAKLRRIDSFDINNKLFKTGAKNLPSLKTDLLISDDRS